VSNQEILGQAKTVRQLLNEKYKVDLYQREYKWETKQIQELIDDLTGTFFDNYRDDHGWDALKDYGHYFLGSIIISRKGADNFIVDGQQRLTSLTLLLMYLRNIQRALPEDDRVNIDDLIFSRFRGARSFNLDIPSRLPAMEALFSGEPFDEAGQEESVQNIMARYEDIEEYFPENLQGSALPLFIDWLINNVHLVEITAFSDEAAYTIFETMNDRGLSLTPTEMLKGFLIAGITDTTKKNLANERWRKRTQQLAEHGKETEADFFKAWLRSQYASKFRERKKGARNEDFERIGTEFHRWVREHATDKDGDLLSIVGSDGFFDFVMRDFDFFSRQYDRMMAASSKMTPGLEPVYRVARAGINSQYMAMMAPLRITDSDEVVTLKMRLVASYLELWWARRVWNWRTIAQNATLNAMFILTRDLRNRDAEGVARYLHETAARMEESFDGNDRFAMHQQNTWQVHLLLARLTEWVETESSVPSRYEEFVTGQGKLRFEVEHIWANMPERHTDDFDSPGVFRDYRNRIGGLLILPKSFNASFGALPFDEKVKHYGAQNLLAASLYETTYERNPGFQHMIARTGLPFRPYPQLGKAQFDERQDLYRQIANQVWNPDLLLGEVAG
jgi:hypothetical protein